VNGKLIKNEITQITITAIDRFIRSFGNNSIIDVIETSVKANYIIQRQTFINNKHNLY
jgi:hypothetical protein